MLNEILVCNALFVAYQFYAVNSMHDTSVVPHTKLRPTFEILRTPPGNVGQKDDGRFQGAVLQPRSRAGSALRCPPLSRPVRLRAPQHPAPALRAVLSHPLPPAPMPPPEPHHLKARRSRRPDAETRRSFDCALTRVGAARSGGSYVWCRLQLPDQPVWCLVQFPNQRVLCCVQRKPPALRPLRL